MTPRNAESEGQRAIWTALIGANRGTYPTQSGKDWMWFCPCHDDGKKSGRRSLAVVFEPDGSTKAHCFACAAAGQASTYYTRLAEAIQIPRDSFNSTRSNGAGTISGHDKQAKTQVISTHTYHDAEGQPVYKVERRRNADGSGHKFYWQYAYVDGKFHYFGGSKPKPEGAKDPTIYNLPAVLKGIQAGQTIYVVEGEKAADKLIDSGLIATTNAGGAGKWKPEFGELLTGADVVILPDHDEPGRKHAQAVAASLHGKTKSVKLVELPGLQEKEDIHDWLTKYGHTAEELSSLANDALEVSAVAEEPKAASKWSQLLRPADLDSRPPKQWLLGQFLGVGDFGMVAGLPGSGKSFIILDLCIGLSLGHVFAGQFAAEQGPRRILYLASEGHEGFGQRFKAVKAKYQVSSPDLTNFRLIEAVPNFYASSGEDSVDELIQGIQGSGFQPDLIVVDTFHDSITGANENDSGDAGIVLKNIQKLRQTLSCAVLVVHHTGKSGETERGSSAYKGKADLLVFVNSNGPSGEMRLGKSKDGGYFDPIPFTLAKDNPNDFSESPRVAWRGEQDFKPVLTNRQQEVLEFLKTQSAPVTITEIADSLNIEDRNNLTTTLTRLCDAGMALRRPQDPDKPKSSRNPFVFVAAKAPVILRDSATGSTRIVISNLDFVSSRPG